MCNYQYEHTLPSSYQGEKCCPIPALFELLPQEGGQAQILPIDSNGCCLFHSTDEQFRAGYNTVEQFKLLLRAVMIFDQKQKEQGVDVNLSELKIGNPVHFEEESLSRATDESEFEIEAFQILHLDLYFDHSIFYAELAFYYCAFSMVSFANVSFQDKISFLDTTFEQCNFHRGSFHGYTTFEQVGFRQFADFSYGTFFSGLSVSEVTFLQEVIFAYSIFKKIEGTAALTKFQARFDRFTDFSECIFETFVIIDYSIFEGEVNFTNAVFKSRFFVQKSAIRANFFIKKDNQEEPIFQDLVDFDIDPEEVTGKIIFENVGFYKIKEQHRHLLLEMAKDNKVEIGPGCIKYRLQTPNKKIDLAQDKQAIIIEFTQSFVNYFLRSSGLNLGLEVKERTKDYIIYFLFSDENISEEEFLQRLVKQEHNFLKLLFPFDLSRSNKAVRKLDNVLSKIDGFAALLSTCIRIGIRISIGEWSKRDTAQLTHAISFKDYQSFDSNSLHEFIASRFDQERIVNNYFINEHIGLKFEQPKFIGGQHQFGDEIHNHPRQTDLDEAED
ncbi:MAG: hypothetical protein AAFO03_00510 [Bacteroidota bacterium]